MRGGVERCESVSCITEAVRHHAYVFFLHAVVSTTSEASGGQGIGTRAAGGGALIPSISKEEAMP